MVRRKACRGELPVPLAEKLEILVVLAAGREDESREKAFHTLREWPLEELQGALRDPSAPTAVLDFAAKELAFARAGLDTALLQNPSLPGPLRKWLENTAALLAEAESSEVAGAQPLPSDAEGAGPEQEDERQKPLTALEQIHRMSVLEKVRTALFGSLEERMILVRDSNKLVARAVMQSPKLSDHEVETFAATKDVCDDVLRLIAQNRKFMRVYGVLRALANNPRTPIKLGLQILGQIKNRDLKVLARNRNVSRLIRYGAERALRHKEEIAAAGIPGRR